MASGRFTSIQCLRGVAASWVVFHHAVLLGSGSALRMLSAPLIALATFGSCGVDLFFVISGFVMANSIGDHARHQRPASFLARRAARVFPLFWILSAVVLVQAGLTGRSYPAASYLNTVTLVPLFDQQGYEYPILYVGWSLGYEMVFYAMVAAVLWGAPSRGIGALLGLVGAAAAIGAASSHVTPALAFVANPIFAEFGLGIVAWLAWRRGLPPAIGRSLIVAGGLLLVSGLFVDLGQGFNVDPIQVVIGASGVKRAIFWGVPSALIVCGSACASEGRAGWLVRLGDASYSLYLIHPIVIAGLTYIAWGNPYLAIAISCGLSIIAAMIVHVVIERPLMAKTGRTISAVGRAIVRVRPTGRLNASATLVTD